MLLIPVQQLSSHPSRLICSVYQALLLSWEIQWLTCQQSGERPLEIFFFLREVWPYSQRKQIFTQHISPTPSTYQQACILHWKEGKDLATLNSPVNFFSCGQLGLFAGIAVRCPSITCTDQEFLINFSSSVQLLPAYKRSALGVCRKGKREPGCAHSMQ